jgi:hypothetical protein
MQPWNDWYHINIHAYGTWLRGDPRGWRARNHREHVDGDYKNPPPPGKYDALYRYSKWLMKRDPVALSRDLRTFILIVMLARLEEFQVPCTIASLDGVHGHFLAQCTKHNPRIIIGIAKQYATAQVKAHGLAVGMNLKPGEGLWSKGSSCKPIASPDHYLSTTNYIEGHGKKGAVVLIPAPDEPE